MIILLFLMKTDIIKTICLSQKEQELYGLDEEDAFFTNMDMDTINMLYLKKKSEADKDIKDLMKFLNGR